MRTLIALIAIFFVSFFSSAGESSTIVGDECVGVWDVAGSPYVVASGCTVPIGETLTIYPGVEVIIGKDQTIEVSGDLIAIGNRHNRVTMKGSTHSHHWEKIYLKNSFGSEFKFCDLSDAKTAIYMEPIKTSETMSIKKIVTFQTVLMKQFMPKQEVGGFATVGSVVQVDIQALIQ